MEAGGFTMIIDPFLKGYGENITDGGSLAAITDFIEGYVCKSMITSLATGMCREYIMDSYDMGPQIGPIQRMRNLFSFLGKCALNITLFALIIITVRVMIVFVNFISKALIQCIKSNKLTLC